MKQNCESNSTYLTISTITMSKLQEQLCS